MSQFDAKRLARWIHRWREEAALDEDGGLPKPLASDVPPPSMPTDVQPFDSPAFCQGEIRLLDPWLVRDARRPLYLAVLREWLDDLWLVAPFGRFDHPATVGELATGRQHDALAVLCLWNARTVPSVVLRQSWYVDMLQPGELASAWSVFQHVTTGKPLSPSFAQRVGPALYHPADPRYDYLEEEAVALRRLTRLAEDYVDRLDIEPTGRPSARETALPDFLVNCLLGQRSGIAMRSATGGHPGLILRAPSLGLRITFRQAAVGQRVVARVTKLTDGTLSNALDGGAVVASGKVIAKFAHGKAELKVVSLAAQIGLRDRQGKSLEVKVESKI